MYQFNMERKMKIMVTSWFGEDFNKNPFSLPINQLGGAEYQTKALCLALKDISDLSYVNLGEPQTCCQGINFCRKNRDAKYEVMFDSYVNLIKDSIECIKPDLIISYLIYPCGDIVAHILNNCYFEKKPVHATICGSADWINILENGQKRSLIRSELIGSSLMNNDIFFSRSHQLAAEIKKRSGAVVEVLRPIITTPHRAITLPDKFRILWISRLCWPKRPDILIEAFITGVTNGVFKNAELNILGDGPDYFKYKKNAEAASASLKESRINFIGFTENRLIWPHLENSTVSVHLSESEGYGNAPAECLLYGIPTIVSGFPQVVKDFSSCKNLLECTLNVDSLISALVNAAQMPNCIPRHLARKFSKRMITEKIIRTAKALL